MSSSKALVASSSDFYASISRFFLVTAIPNHLLSAAVRSYPLRQVAEPRIFVAGERIGQRVPSISAGGGPVPPQANGVAVGPVGPMPVAQVPAPVAPHVNPMGMGLGLGIAPAALAQQNQALDALERERRSRIAAAAAGNVPPGGPVPGAAPPVTRQVEEDDSAGKLLFYLSRWRVSAFLVTSYFHFFQMSTKPFRYVLLQPNDFDAITNSCRRSFIGHLKVSASVIFAPECSFKGFCFIRETETSTYSFTL